MTRYSANGHQSSHGGYDWVVPSDGSALVVPDAHLLFTGTFRKIGPDLVIEGDGKRALLPDYFAHEGAALHSIEGARLDAETVRALSGLDSPWVVAQAGGTAGPAEIGTVRKLVGTASVVRGSTTQTLANGDPVYQGDVVQTGTASTLGIILKDNTVFSLSSDARMVMNQLVYDAARTDNSMSMSLVQGSFVFITGQVAKTGTVSVSTPVATMGIRGTTPIVKLSALDGSGEFSLSADPNRAVGNYILYDVNGNEVARVGSTDITVRIQSAAGPFETVTKSIADTAADNALVAPAFETYLLINQRADNSTRPETGKGQGTEGFQFAFKVTNIALLGETRLLDDGLFDTLQYLGGSRASVPNDVLPPPGAPFSVDLDTSTPGKDRFVSYAENSGSLPVTSAAQITVPNGATTITSATVILVNALAGDEMRIAPLPPGITATITFGSIHVNLTGTASVAAYIAAIQSIQFANTSDNPSTDIREITVTVVASNGETATATTFITIEAVNDAPVNHLPAGQLSGEDGSLVYSHANGNAITVTDPDAGSHPITTTLTVQHGTLTAGALIAGVTISGDGSGTLVLTGPQNLINQALDGLAYHPAAGFHGNDAVVMSTNDNNTDGGQGSGGPLATPSAGTGITVTSVNDAPTGTNATLTTTEDTPVVITAANFGFSDPNDVPANVLLAVKITTLPEGGTLTLDGHPVSPGQLVAAVDIEAGKFLYTPAHDSTAEATFTFQVQDDGGTSNGGIDLDPTPRTLSVTVTAVNDAPTVSGPVASLPTSGFAVETLNPNFTPFETSPGVYQLTNEQSSQAAAIWHGIDLSQNWTWTTQVKLSSAFNPGGADGMTFTLQAQGTNALSQLGGDGQSHGGGSLGIGGFSGNGLPGAFGIWIDTWDNGETIEANGNSISFFANNGGGQTDVPSGAQPHEFSTALENGQWNNLQIAWNAATETLSYRFTITDTGETFAASQHFDGVTPEQSYYFGFTAATGAAFNDQAVAVLSVETFHAVGQTPLSLKATGFAIADVDAGSGILTATFRLGDENQGALNATAGDSGISIVSGNGTSELVLSGTLEQLNAFLGHGGTSALTFTAIQDEHRPSTTLTLQVDDNGNAGSGGPLSASFTTTIFIDDGEVIANPDMGTARVANWNGTLANEDATGNVLANDSNSGGTLAITAVSNGLISETIPVGGEIALHGQFGQLTLATDGSYTYTPDSDLLTMDNVAPGNMPLRDAFTYSVTGSNNTTTSTLTIEIAPSTAHLHTNADTNAAYVSFETHQDVTPVATAADVTGNVISNDYTEESSEAGPVVIAISREVPGGSTSIATESAIGEGSAFVIQGLYGTLVMRSGGDYTYQADGTNAAVQDLAQNPANGVLTDAFTYSAEFEGVARTATLTITLNGTLALDDRATAIEAGGVNGDVAGQDAVGNVLGNDNGLDTITDIRAVYSGQIGGETLGYFGVLRMEEDGHYTYTVNPDLQFLDEGQHVQDIFTYSASANGGPDNKATLTIDIVGQNNAPVTQAFVAYAIASDRSDYSVTIGDRVIDDGFAFVAANSSTATAAGIGNLASHISNDSYTFTLSDIPAVFAELDFGARTTVNVGFVATDGTYSTPGTFTFDVVSDHTPQASSFSVYLSEAGGIANGTSGTSIASGNLLEHVTDQDVADHGDMVHVTSIDSRVVAGSITFSNGFLTYNVSENGTFTVTLNDASVFIDALEANSKIYSGFSYTVTDSLGFSASASMTVVVAGVNDAPVAHSDSQIVAMPAASDVVVYGGNVLANDTDVDFGAQLHVSFVSGDGGSGEVGFAGRTVEGHFGQLTIREDGSYSYAPLAAGGSGSLAPDVFQYTITDDQDATSVNTLTFDRVPDMSPVGVADTNSVEEATGPAALQTGGTAAIGNVLANDSDADSGDAITVVGIASAVTSNGTVGHALSGEFGTLLIAANGSYRYVADDNQGVRGSETSVDKLGDGETQVDTFTYTIADSHGVTTTSTLSITINGHDDAPRVSPLNFNIDEDYVSFGYYGGKTSEFKIAIFDTANDPEGTSLELHNVTITPDLTTAAATGLVQPVDFTVDERGEISFDVRQFYYLQSALGGDASGTPDAMKLTIGYDVTDQTGLTTHGTASVDISGLIEGAIFTGLGRSVEAIDFASANFHNTKTVAFAADAPLQNPGYAIDVLTNFDNTQHRIDLSSLFDALAPGSVNASNIVDYVKAAVDGTSVVVGVSAISGTPFNVASIAGTAGSDHHAIAGGDVIAIVFDHANVANVVVH